MNRKKAFMLIIGIITATILVSAFSYAFFTYSKEGTSENTIKSGSVSFFYDEQRQVGNGINIEDALPVSDSEGKSSTNYFNFKIVSRALNNATIPYEITLRKKNGSDDLDSILKVYLAKTDSYNTPVANEEEVLTSFYSDLITTSKNGYSEKLLYTGNVEASTNTYIQNYRLKMWIDESAEDYFNKTFTLTVNVYAEGHILDANSSVATIDSVSVDKEVLTPTLINGVDTYIKSLPEGTGQTNIIVNTNNYTQVTIIKTESDYETPIAFTGEIRRLSSLNKLVSLSNGNNYFKVTATSEDGDHVVLAHIKVVVGIVETAIQSAPTDEIYYYEGNNKIIVGTTDANGLLSNVSVPIGVTLYSTVAKDPDNTQLPFTKTFNDISDTIYLMPDGEIIYWYGYNPGGTTGGITSNAGGTRVLFETNSISDVCSGTTIVTKVYSNPYLVDNYTSLKAVINRWNYIYQGASTGGIKKLGLTTSTAIDESFTTYRDISGEGDAALFSVDISAQTGYQRISYASRHNYGAGYSLDTIYALWFE